MPDDNEGTLKKLVNAAKSAAAVRMGVTVPGAKRVELANGETVSEAELMKRKAVAKIQAAAQRSEEQQAQMNDRVAEQAKTHFPRATGAVQGFVRDFMAPAVQASEQRAQKQEQTELKELEIQRQIDAMKYWQEQQRIAELKERLRANN